MLSFKRNPYTQRFSSLPESFAPALKMLLQQLNDDEVAEELKIKGCQGCHFRARATWESVSLFTNKRVITLSNTGEITEKPLKK